eukprot:850449_1
MNKPNMIHQSLQDSMSKFDAHKSAQKSVHLLDYSSSISYDQTHDTCTDLKDRTAFSHKFAEEIAEIAELQCLIKESNYYINMLYTYRSLSKPLPMIPADLSDTEKSNLYLTVFNILTPNIHKINALMEFHDRFVKALVKNMRLLIFPMEKKEIVSHDHIKILLRVVDQFFVLSFLKDVKGQIKNDFSRYKRSFSFIRSTLDNAGQLMADITEIHNFLNDPMQPHHIVLHRAKVDMASVPHREALFAIMIHKAIQFIKHKEYVTPNEKHGLYRAILGCIYLCDDSQCGINIFKSKHLRMNKVADVLERLPIVPVFMDLHTTVEYSLRMCDHYNSEMGGFTSWIGIDKKDDKKTYDLVRCKKRIHAEYTAFTASFVKLLHDLKHLESCSEIDATAFELIIGGMKLLGDWTAKLQEQIAYKAAHPISQSEFVSLGGSIGDDNPYASYEQMTRFNYSNELKHAMVEVIGLIKGLSNMLCSAETQLRNVLCRYVQSTLQQFALKSLIWPLNKAFKKKKEHLEHLLLSIRMAVADTDDNLLLKSDYKTKREKDIKQCMMQYEYEHQSRVLYPTETQILLVRRLLMEVFSDEAPHQRQHNMAMFGWAFLSKAQVALFSDLYDLLGNTLYIGNYSHIVRECSDLSSLWYREFHLNLTNVIQFPISMSIPWLLTEFAVSTPSLAPNVLFGLSIYNDCAETALSTFGQQHLFDEVEAEVNLVFDQLMFTLYRKIFDCFKNRASQRLFNSQTTLNTLHRQSPLARYECILNQKHVTILGRNIDIESLLTEQLNSFIRENIEMIISRYESAPITSCCEISHLLKTLQLTVEMLREEMASIDPFEDMFCQVNEDTTMGSFRGRLFLETHNKLFSELLRSYSFNQLTQRFVSLSQIKKTKRMDSLYLWGSRLTQIYQQQFKVTQGFFGSPHVESITHLLGMDNMPLLVDETVKTVAHIIIRDISPYVEEILKNLDPMKLQNAYYGVTGVFGYYDLSLKYIKQYPALREGVFTLLREAGNALALIQLFDIVLTNESYYNHQIQCAYKGCARVLSDNVSNVFASCVCNAMKREECLTTNSGGWLTSATLQYLHQNLLETGLLKTWKGPPPKNGILEHENPKDFSRFWSVAMFIFLMPDAADDELNCNRAQFGDGWLLAGTTILYLTNLIDRYKLLDPTMYLDKLQRLYPVDLDSVPSKSGSNFGGLFNRNRNKSKP